MKFFWVGMSTLLAIGLIFCSLALQDVNSQLTELDAELTEIEEHPVIQAMVRTHPRWVLLYRENGLQCAYGPNALGDKFISTCEPDMSQPRHRKPL